MAYPTTQPRTGRLGSGIRLAIAAVVAANLMWGASIVAATFALDGLPPLTLGLARCLIALAVLLPLARRAGRPSVARRDAFLLGLTGVGLFFVCNNLGLLFTSATNATLILDGGEPVAGALLAVLLLRERLGALRLAGALLALAGIALVVLTGRDGAVGVSRSLLGDVLMVAAVLSWAAYLVIGRRVFASGADPIAVVTRATLVGAALLLPIAAVEIAVVGFGQIGVADLLLLLYLGIGCTALTDVLLGYGLARIEASRAAVLGNVAPLTGLACAVLFLGETFTPPQAAGGLLTLIGIWLATTSPDRTDAGATSVHEDGVAVTVGLADGRP